VLIFNASGTQPEPTPTPTTEPEPDQIVLAFEGPAAVEVSETFSVTVVAQDVPDPGLYGVQFEVHYDPALISAGNLQINPDFEFVVIQNTDNVSGTITLVASRQGDVPSLLGDVNLLTFDATAIMSGTVTFTFEGEQIGDSAANAFDIVTESYEVAMGQVPTPEPTDEPTPEPTDEPTPEPTDEPTPEPTDEPTPEPTDEPTPEPTDEPTPEPTDEPTPEPTDEPTPEPELVSVSGQVILAGRAGNDWSNAVVTVENGSVFSDTTDVAGEFSIADVPAGPYSAITADAAGYLPAACLSPTVTISETVLNTVSLLSGNIIDEPPAPPTIDIADATAVGASFGATGPDLAADINRDQIVNIFDVILVSVNYGQVGPQTWDCLSP
jgi:outer membrane biosynthesis protein TonB